MSADKIYFVGVSSDPGRARFQVILSQSGSRGTQSQRQSPHTAISFAITTWRAYELCFNPPMALRLDSLVAPLPVISHDAIADMDDVRYLAHMAILIVAQSFRELPIGYRSAEDRLGIKDMADLLHNKYSSALHLGTWLYYAQRCLTR